MGQEEAIAHSLLELLDQAEKHKTMSDLDENEIGVLSLLETMSQRLKIDELGNFVHNYAKFKVSRARLGRREITSAITLGSAGFEDRRKAKSIKDLFGGMR